MPRRTAGVPCPLLLALVLATGCQVDGQDQDDASLAENRERAAALAERWEALPGVERVRVSYVDDLDNSPGLNASISCSGCDVSGMADRVTREVWASQLDPLRTIRVRVLDEEDQADRVSESFVLPDDGAELERRFGER